MENEVSVKTWDDFNTTAGTKPYDGYQTYDEWKREFDGYCGMGSELSDRYYIPLPIWTGGNCFFNGAQPCDKELHTGIYLKMIMGHFINCRLSICMKSIKVI